MRLFAFVIAFLTAWNVSGQVFDKFKLTDSEIPAGYKATDKLLCKAIQPKIFFENPDLYKSILGTVKSKDFQSFESKDDKGTVLFFEYEKKVEGEAFLDGLLWGGSKPTKEHPEEYAIKDNILIIWSFDKKSAIKDVSKKKVNGAP